MARSGPPSIGIAIERTHSHDGCRDYFRLDLLGVLKVCSLHICMPTILTMASAFNAIVSSSVVALDLSYAMPIAVNCLRGRNLLPPRAWQLPSGMGWLADIVSYRVICYVVQSAVLMNGMQLGLSYIALTTVLFLFPPGRPVTGSSMSECRSPVVGLC